MFQVHVFLFSLLSFTKIWNLRWRLLTLITMKFSNPPDSYSGQAIKYGLTTKTQLLQWIQFIWNIRANHNSLEVEQLAIWKMMLGRRSVSFEMVPKIQGRIIKLRGCIVPKNGIFRGIFWRGFKELNHHHFGESFTGRGREQKFAEKRCVKKHGNP